MAVTATPIFLQALKRWDASINNGDASNWRRLMDGSGNGGGANGSKVTFVGLAGNDSSLRNIQIAHTRPQACTVSSSTPALVTATGHNLSIGDQFFFTATTVPTGTTALLPYFVISAGFVAGSAFEFSTSAGGAAVNTTGTGTAVFIWPVKIMTTVPLAITGGTDGSTGPSYFLHPTYFPGAPFDNDGNPYLLLENGDYLAVSCTGTVTANKTIYAVALGGNF